MKMKKHLKFTLYLSIIVIVIMVGVSLLDLFQIVRMKSLDFYFHSRGETNPSTDIIIVAIDDMSLKEIGVWPWPRRYHAQLIDFLKKAGVKVIGFDVVFSDNAPLPQDDQALMLATKNAGNVYYAMYFSPQRRKRAQTKKVSIIVTTEKERETEELLPAFSLFSRGAAHLSMGEAEEATIPIPGLVRVARGLGNINYEPEKDGVIRYGQLAVNYKGKFYPSLSLCLAGGYLDISQNNIKIGKDIDMVDRKIPINAQGKILVNYTGGFERFRIIPYYRVLTGEIPASEFKNKIVLVGSTAVGVYDLRVTPFSENFPGVGVHANIVNSILNKKFIIPVPEIFGLVIIVISGLLLGFYLPKLPPHVYPLFNAIFTVAALLILVTAGIFLFGQGYYLDFVYPGGTIVFCYLSISLYRFVSEEREKREVKNAFGRYVNPDVVNELLNDPGKLSLGGDKKMLTILFSDVRGFTTISENLQPEEVVNLLNEYFTQMSEIILKYEGTLDKFIGDAIMAFFGAPIAHTDDAPRAVKVAWEMQQKIKEINKRHAGEVRGQFKMGIGINTGNVVVGNIGSHRRMDYTAIGDDVNLAQRLEDMAEGGEILITESTYNLVKDIVQVNKLEPVQVKGRAGAVQIYEVTGVK
ncbi:hypothetical protein COS91_06370 [Candidatus Desantisbacteria bacterium CG07_land_8_20_14_0_80_39_15]|uniref:Guanylate cyclase domain-containing protein n=1 Tax=Candidatus Desantisbacteria bacterium CG07_land_8_20_14_0_80_39_15 TaxID=1974549 RepID=A0A2M6ZFE4_9BACT|nr:MAG: hypothetical protein COS91_06370 [Candidatus Desantisbacteria bacterium CG07_land_8_20_14_0_80_39_15]